MNLIEAIKKEQARRNLSDRQFSRLLEIDNSLWFRIKNGQRQPSVRFLKALMNQMPEVALAVQDYLRGESYPKKERNS